MLQGLLTIKLTPSARNILRRSSFLIALRSSCNKSPCLVQIPLMICFPHKKKKAAETQLRGRSRLASLRQQRRQVSLGFPCTCPCEAQGFVCRSLQGVKSGPVHGAGRSAQVTGSQDTGLQSPTKNKTSKHSHSSGRTERCAGIHKSNAAPRGRQKGLCLQSRLFSGDLTTFTRSVST